MSDSVFLRLKKVRSNLHQTCFKQDAFNVTINQILTFLMTTKTTHHACFLKAKTLAKYAMQCTAKKSSMSVEQLYKRITRILTTYVLFLSRLLLFCCMLHTFKNTRDQFFQRILFFTKTNWIPSCFYFLQPSAWFFLLGPWKESNGISIKFVSVSQSMCF